MLIVIGYKKKVIIFRHHKREVLTPIYKDVGKGRPKENISKDKIKD